jgi:hypothetical protein
VSHDPPPLFRSSAQPGYTSEIGRHPQRIVARKLEREVQVRFSREASTVQTNEGMVRVNPGDAILTGINGENWRVSRQRFSLKYRPAPPTHAGEDGAYISLPTTVFAVRMDLDFQVLLADGESRLSGRTGDWLVDYGDGSLGIVADQAFSETYEIVG